jgi:sulfur carrier protein
VKVILRNPRREVEVAGGRRVKDILRELDVIPETVLVIRGDNLVTADQLVRDDDVIELRPVMSGGSASRGRATDEASGEMARGRASRGRATDEASGEMARGRASRGRAT